MELDVAHHHGALAFGGEYAAAKHRLDDERIAAGEVAHRLRIPRGRLGEAFAGRVFAERLQHRTHLRRDRVLDMNRPERRRHGSLASTFATMRSQRSPAKPNASSQARSTLAASASRKRLRARKSRLRTVAGGMRSTSAVSSTESSSTPRSMNTAR